MSKEKKAIRKKFRQVVFERDNYQCRYCDQREGLDAHHITDRNELPNGGYVRENGITLCPEHHELAEVYHQSGGSNWVEGFHPDDLYNLIGSSRECSFSKV